MATPKEILRALDLERFSEVLSASPKQFREELFRRAGIKKKKGGAFALGNPRAEDRAKRLAEALRDGADISDEILEEVIRNYLYTRRGLLADALDHFAVPHDNGLTEQDLDFIETMTPAQGAELKTLLAERHDPKDVELYLAYMRIPEAG